MGLEPAQYSFFNAKSMSMVSNATLRDNKAITDRSPSPDVITRQL